MTVNPNSEGQRSILLRLWGRIPSPSTDPTRDGLTSWRSHGVLSISVSIAVA